MFESLLRKRTHHFSKATSLAEWASLRGLDYAELFDGQHAMGGELFGRAFRAERISTRRPYMKGTAWMARCDLGLSPEVEAVVLNRPLKRRFEGEIEEMRAQASAVGAGKPPPVAEELIWTDEFPDQGWSGPDDFFWDRYAVLTDVREVVRRWINEEAVDRLMSWPSAVTQETPLMYMLVRGKLYMRMQAMPAADPAVALHALDTMEFLSGRALALMDQSKR
ncbi:hypothetical protein [Hydrogenophaga sp. 5NK40-0174]|uniref:hypothetical protein n=1 Tax=Hydrogenophaga sp. 5NK40-0174 TaxID=3127649 RepID=UPI0031067954